MKYLLFITIVFFSLFAEGQKNNLRLVDYSAIVPGDAQFDRYLPLLSGKNVALVVNHSSFVGTTSLLDTLTSLGIKIRKIFTPEHGYKGTASEGKYVANSSTEGGAIKVISLYGKKKKPAPEDLQDVDEVVFDLQDVGVRFYTYISTMSLMMEACAENGIPLIVLDRPNPNGFYVDGPVLQPEYKSFVGMHPVPVVYGMTIGEYARMVNGEGWMKNGVQCNLTVIPLKNYTRSMIVKLPIKPSPNLPDWRSVYLYPSLCFFEGTVVSVGRGTDTPFQRYGHPDLRLGNYVFTPKANGVSAHPKLENRKCFGQNLSNYAAHYRKNPQKLNLSWLITAYGQLKEHTKFFNAYFDKLAGSDQLRKQIEAGKNEQEIRASWHNDLKKFMQIRKKYLIYR